MSTNMSPNQPPEKPAAIMTPAPDKKNNLEPELQENPWVEGLKTIVVALLLAFGIRTFIAEARFIPSGSMEPTLQGSPNRWYADQILVDKVGYRFSQPQAKDIVVFRPTDELQRQRFNDAFIKRIIGVPGDRVELRRGQVYVNGAPLSEPYIYPGAETTLATCQGSLSELSPFLEHPVTIPDHHFLVLGDNRESSYDGRCWGLVPQDRIIGRAVFRFWPPTRMGGLN